MENACRNCLLTLTETYKFNLLSVKRAVSHKNQEIPKQRCTMGYYDNKTASKTNHKINKLLACPQKPNIFLNTTTGYNTIKFMGDCAYAIT